MATETDSSQPAPRLRTARLELFAAEAALAEADAARDHTRLATLLSAQIPAAWPPNLTLDALDLWARTLATHPEQAGWWGWFFVRDEGAPHHRMLLGGGGFKGPPDEAGRVEIGYAVLDPFRQRGFATEAMRALVTWAFGDARVQLAVAETFPDQTPSLGVIEKLGMTYVGDGEEAGAVRFALPRARFEAVRGTWDSR